MSGMPEGVSAVCIYCEAAGATTRTSEYVAIKQPIRSQQYVVRYIPLSAGFTRLYNARPCRGPHRRDAAALRALRLRLKLLSL